MASRAPQVVDLLELTPMREVPWLERDDGKVVIDRPRPPIDGLRGLFNRRGCYGAGRGG